VHWSGLNNPKTGTTVPLDKRKPVTREVTVCVQCGGPFEVKKSHVSRRRCCSRECYAAWQSENVTGPDHPSWRGGTFRYYGPSWRAARRAVRERDRACLDCGISPEELNRALDVHHLVPFRSFGVDRHKEANDLNNLIALCNVCHMNFEWETNRRVPLPAG